MNYDTIVVGGGLVGAAVAHGLGRLGEKVLVLDEGDVAFRASRGNFGLVWVQSKGEGMPEYARWSRHSADVWPDFSEELQEQTGVDTAYHKAGGVHLCLSEEAWERQSALIKRMHNVHGSDYGAVMIKRDELIKMLPGIGPEVVGASWSPHDGHASPLYLLRALHESITRFGGAYRNEARVENIEKDGSGYRVTTAVGSFKGAKVVLAAGLGNRKLGPLVGLEVPVFPQKGQILVTERTEMKFSMPTVFIRQTDEGSFLLGDSHEDAGFDLTSRTGIMADIATRAIRSFPFLKDLRLVRSWAALRVMSPDGFPIYQQSDSHPGVFSVNCHSGVTLAGAHARTLAPMIARGRLEEPMSAFSTERLNVQAH